MDKILTVDEVAEIIKVKPITVREMFREKRLRAFKVGKAWRTTETMLEEDLAALARGEKPAVLEQAVTSTAPSPEPAQEPEPEPVRKRKAANPPEEGEDDDTQQLLF